MKVNWAEGFEIESQDVYRWKILYLYTLYFVKYNGRYVGTFKFLKEAQSAIQMHRAINLLEENKQ